MQFQRTAWLNDPRSEQFTLTKFGAPLVSLPKTLARPRGPVLNQYNTLRCTGYGSAANGWYIHGKQMNPDWAAAKIGEKQGRSVDGYGADPNATMKHMRDDGFLPTEVNNQMLATGYTQEQTTMGTWSDTLDFEATNYDNISGFVKVDNRSSDYFDAIKRALTQSYNAATKKGQAVDAFSAWYHDWDKGLITSPAYFAGFHRYIFIDFETINNKEYLIAQNSYGEAYGEHGFHYFPREIINWEYSQPGRSLKLLMTLTPEQIAEAKRDTPLGRAWKQLILIWRDFSNKYGMYA